MVRASAGSAGGRGAAQMCQCMELGHLCMRQCINNYGRNVRNMTNNDSIVIVAAIKKLARNECHEIGAAG